MSEKAANSPSSALQSQMIGGRSFAFAIHGGAGEIADTAQCKERKDYLKLLISEAYNIAQNALTQPQSESPASIALRIGEHTCMRFEESGLFNAGRGACLTKSKRQETEASIMCGTSLKCGASTLLHKVKYPVQLARCIMEKTEHVLLGGSAAEDFAHQNGLEMMTDKEVEAWEEKMAARINNNASEVPTNPLETVGCVVMFDGHLAAATSTGGRSNKMDGRIGDTPTIGAGNYANNTTVAVSGSGWGEEFQRRCGAYDVHARLKYGGTQRCRANEAEGNSHVVTSLDAVLQQTLEEFPPATAGMICVDRKGEVAMRYNTQGFYRGMADSTSQMGKVGIWDEMEKFKVFPAC